MDARIKSGHDICPMQFALRVIRATLTYIAAAECHACRYRVKPGDDNLGLRSHAQWMLMDSNFNQLVRKT